MSLNNHSSKMDINEAVVGILTDTVCGFRCLCKFAGKSFLSKGAILTWAGGGGGRPSLAPGEEWLLRISPPQNGGIGGTMAL